MLAIEIPELSYEDFNEVEPCPAIADVFKDRIANV